MLKISLGGWELIRAASDPTFTAITNPFHTLQNYKWLQLLFLDVIMN
ncbi:hypothetical protein C5167_012719 [Papaver somniferum]|uniref:Uncharacterized protein n=1 Tax=Papaver somniferum TaxID=3469 RepID=A0A4Y7IY89_PAPSO|nr:hypothetical protein C5167_012719 [Papaver somniferum]